MPHYRRIPTNFTPSIEIRVSVLSERRQWVCLPKMIGRAVRREDAIAFDVWEDRRLAGFAMLRKFQEGEWFLWECVIDGKEQRRGYGRKALRELIRLMQANYDHRLHLGQYGGCPAVRIAGI